MSEYFLRLDPMEIYSDQKIDIEIILETHKLLTREQFNKVIEGFENEYDYESYLSLNTNNG